MDFYLITQTDITLSATSTAICGNQPIEFTANPTNPGSNPVYQWYLNGNLVGANSTAFELLNPAPNDEVYVTLVSSVTCPSSAVNSSSLVTLSSNTVTPTVSVAASQTAICPGTVVNFTSNQQNGGSAPSYIWKVNGAAVANGPSFMINSLQNGDQVTLEMVSSANCVSTPNAVSAPVAMVVNPLTTITAQPAAVTQCDGTAATFTVAATGTGSLNYQWLLDGNNVSGANAATINLPSIAAANAGNYTVAVTGACGTVTSMPASLTVNPVTTVATQPAAITQCGGTNATFSVVAAGTGPFTYQWKQGTSNVTGATSASLNLNNITSADAGSYTVEVSGACGAMVTSSPAALTLSPSTVITTQPVAVTQCVGGNATLTVAGTGSGTLSYQWKNAGVNISGATSASYTITGLTAANTGSYTVDVIGGCGTLASNPATITVNPATTITTQPQAVTQCAGTNATFNVTPAGTGPFTYVWKQNGTAISGATSSTYTSNNITASSAGNYTVEVTGACGPMVASTTASLTINAATVITTQPTSFTQCENTPASISGAATGTGAITYQWKFNGTAIPGASMATLAVPALALSNAGVYTMEATGACGTVSSNAALVGVFPQPMVTASTSSSQVCNGNMVTLTGGGAVSYSWNNSVSDGVAFAPSATTTYTVTGTDANNCSNTATVTVTHFNLPTVTANTSHTVLCEAEMLTLYGTGTGAGNLTYTWDNGVTDDEPFASSVTTTYTVTATDANNCSNTDEVTITVNPLPVSTINYGSGSVCNGDAVTVTVDNNYDYDFGGTITPDVPFVPAATQTYTVVITDLATSCNVSDQFTIVVNELPAVTASATATTVCNGTEVTLTGGGADAYTWTNNVVNDEPFAPNATASYVVTGVDANGCEATAAISITVNPLPEVALADFEVACYYLDAFELTQGTPSGGNYSGAGISGTASNMFDPAVAGVGTHEIAYTYTDANTCSNTAQKPMVVDRCTGVEDAGFASFEVKLYPNPAYNFFNLEITTPASEEAEILLFNSNGKTGFTGKTST